MVRSLEFRAALHMKFAVRAEVVGRSLHGKVKPHQAWGLGCRV